MISDGKCVALSVSKSFGVEYSTMAYVSLSRRLCRQFGAEKGAFEYVLTSGRYLIRRATMSRRSSPGGFASKVRISILTFSTFPNTWTDVLSRCLSQALRAIPNLSGPGLFITGSGVTTRSLRGQSTAQDGRVENEVRLWLRAANSSMRGPVYCMKKCVAYRFLRPKYGSSISWYFNLVTWRSWVVYNTSAGTSAML